MSTVTGFSDSDGSPTITIKVRGSIDANEQEFKAIIDTGFTGFLSMPLLRAVPLGLPLYGTTSLTLADGTTRTHLVATGHVSISDNQSGSGVVVLQTNSSELLVGMDFIRVLGPTLVLRCDKHLIAPLSGDDADALTANLGL